MINHMSKGGFTLVLNTEGSLFSQKTNSSWATDWLEF